MRETAPRTLLPARRGRKGEVASREEEAGHIFTLHGGGGLMQLVDHESSERVVEIGLPLDQGGAQLQDPDITALGLLERVEHLEPLDFTDHQTPPGSWNSFSGPSESRPTSFVRSLLPGPGGFRGQPRKGES